MPGFWSFIDASTITTDVAGVEYFTPINLFIVLNLLILTILALAHFHTTATYSTHAAYNYSRTRSQQEAAAAAAAATSAAVADHVGVDAHERLSEDRPIAGAGQQLHAGDRRLVSDHDYARADLDAALAVLRHDRSVILSERLLHGDGDDDESAHIDGAAAGTYIIADFMQLTGYGDSHHRDDDTDRTDGGRPQYYDAGAGQTSHFEIKIYKLQDQGINDHTQEDDQAPAVAAGFTMSRIAESSSTVQESTLTQLQPSAAADRHLVHSIINDSEEETGKSSPEMKFSSSSKTKDAEPAEIGQYARHQDESAAAAAAGVDDDHDQLLDIDSILAKNGSLFRHSRPLASAHFTPRRKAAAASSANDRPLSPLRISKPNIVKRGDTLDAIWKAICESKRNSSPFNRHHPLTLNHNNIIENEGNVHHHHAQSHVRNLAVSPIKIASIRNTQLNTNAGHHESLTRPHHRVRRRREPSMAQDELNAKVESFISKFNAQIKIQREKSLLDFMEMVGRGSS